MSDAKKNLLLFFDRPSEPCFMQKGDEKAVFEIPDHYYPDKYKQLTSTISNRFGGDAGRAIPVRNIALPNLALPMELPYNDQFSLFVPKHRVMAGKLIDIFMGMRDLEDLQSVCSFCQLRINPYMFNYCLSVAILHRSIVNKDRRGELFYYMHQQIIARYNMERLCNGLQRVRRFMNFREPIDEGYFPKLDSQVASRAWPPRFAGTTIRDLDRPVDQIRADVSELETWRDRFVQAVESLTVTLPNNRQMPLDEERGIDILGNMMESSIISPNRGYYGDLHNMGHVFISYSHDPDHRHLEQFGVMGDSATAMRDPVFYRWHSYIDDLFQLYKYKLNPYSDDKLDFPGIRLSSVSLEGPAGNNTVGTFWELSTVELGRGLDFTPRGSVLARFTHLQHQDFTYVLEVNNTSGQGVMGTVRIFMAPTVNEQGEPLGFDEQRRAMVELDKFTAGLRPGNNTIRHRSLDSSVTIPYERTFRDQSARPGDPGSSEAAEFDFCGCGWPHHMLIPKGTAQGYPVVLFAMISNWADDRVEQDLVGSCNDAASYCGIRDRRYPDRRAMGFPFDRPAPAQALSDFLRPNMAVNDVTIRFSDTTRPRQQRR
ncbi:hypothetical protein B5X24_HaOG206118 [Helicoverpa armigera]|uniref:tyrosinase n=1 Tax=Helicoverpa armigera TaxID=29058 RepID=A0A2W1BKG9_HELAM|nr:hypothetical protein B5X24_HaOG206118 [Helicoverpa armigera]